MNLTKRLEALEAAAVKAAGSEEIDMIDIIIDTDRSIMGAYRDDRNGQAVAASDDELAEIKRQRALGALQYGLTRRIT